MTNFIETAESRQTSPELMEAILRVANGNEAIAERIWEDGPTSVELVSIIEIVTCNGAYDTTDFLWGDMGENWAESLSEPEPSSFSVYSPLSHYLPEIHQEELVDENCSGIVEINGRKRCKHGFPLTPSCCDDPMRGGVYRTVPCLNEEWTGNLHPDTGKLMAPPLFKKI